MRAERERKEPTSETAQSQTGPRDAARLPATACMWKRGRTHSQCVAPWTCREIRVRGGGSQGGKEKGRMAQSTRLVWREKTAGRGCRKQRGSRKQPVALGSSMLPTRVLRPEAGGPASRGYGRAPEQAVWMN